MALEERSDRHVSDDLLTRALHGRGCPICLVLQSKTYDLLCDLQIEAVRDEKINAVVLSAGGYCQFHFWYLEKLASPVTNAQLLEQLLAKINKECFEDTAGDSASSFDDVSRCPVCRSCREWEEKLLACFTEKIPEKDFSAAYESSPGLCLPHLSKALRKISEREQRAFLIQNGRRQLNTLIQELRLLVTKWHNKDRTPGRENDSSYRAIGKLVGGRHFRTG